MKLTNMQIKKARYGEGKTKLFDGGGLFLWLKPSGSKIWNFKYTFEGKEKLISLGGFPLVSLAYAREKHRKFKTMLKDGINPSQWRTDNRAKAIQKQNDAAEQAKADATTFEVVALEWLETRKEKLNEKYRQTLKGRFYKRVFPTIGKTPIAKLERAPLIELLLYIANVSETPQTAQRVTIQ